MIEEKQAVKKSKNTLRKYRDSKLSTSLQILNYLFTELPETTRKRLEIIYNLEKSNDNIEAVFVSNNKKFIPQNDPYLRKAIVEKDPCVGNARHQKTLSSNIPDEELGSLLLFKVPRNCRDYKINEGLSTLNSDPIEANKGAVVGNTADYDGNIFSQ